MRTAAMIASEKRQINILARPIFVDAISGVIAMSVQFSLERINTPTGRMVIVTDDTLPARGRLGRP